MNKLAITPKAQNVVAQLQTENGPLLFLISGGCCDGSAPLCFLQKEFKLGQNDVLLGYVTEDCPVYISDILSEYFKNSDRFLLDVETGRGGGFSLEAPLGVRFLNRASCII